MLDNSLRNIQGYVYLGGYVYKRGKSIAVYWISEQDCQIYNFYLSKLHLIVVLLL